MNSPPQRLHAACHTLKERDDAVRCVIPGCQRVIDWPTPRRCWQCQDAGERFLEEERLADPDGEARLAAHWGCP